jgi:hypothetical protein
MWPILDVRQRRLYVAAEAMASGHGVFTIISRISGLSPASIAKAIKEFITYLKDDGRI